MEYVVKHSFDSRTVAVVSADNEAHAIAQAVAIKKLNQRIASRLYAEKVADDNSIR